jgi:hypothetical protein
MGIFQIRFLIFLSILCLVFSCNQYRHLRKIQTDSSCLQKLKPDFSHTMYKTAVDVLGKHISGILLIKSMPDSSTRIVFSNEMGFSFFDFGFGPDTGFHVYQITPQMNKNGLIKTLRKDFELLLFKNMDYKNSYVLTDSNRLYHAFPQSQGINYYITDMPCTHLMGMQRASSTKPVMDVTIDSKSQDNPPDSLFIRHYIKINFTISLKKLSALAAQ